MRGAPRELGRLATAREPGWRRGRCGQGLQGEVGRLRWRRKGREGEGEAPMGKGERSPTPREFSAPGKPGALLAGTQGHRVSAAPARL